MRRRRAMLRACPNKYAIYVVVATVLALFAGTTAQTPLAVMRTANALPAGFFLLELDGGGGVMDVESANQQVTGFVHFNTPNARDSQLWKERFPTGGSIGVIKLENKSTGQCLADSAGNDARVTIRPCSDEATLWQKIPHPQSRVVLRRTTRLLGPFPNIHVCPGRSGAFVNTVTCNGDTFSGATIWHATLSPVGSTTSPLTPATPPVAPTNCKLTGSGGICGMVGFGCDPFSGVDEIVVRSGKVGVAVTGIEPQIGKIVGTYLNEGTASIAVCGWRSGMIACGNPIPDVSFGPTLCVHRPLPPPPCPPGHFQCAGVCRPAGSCDHQQ